MSNNQNHHALIAARQAIQDLNATRQASYSEILETLSADELFQAEQMIDVWHKTGACSENYQKQWRQILTANTADRKNLLLAQGKNLNAMLQNSPLAHIAQARNTGEIPVVQLF